MSYTGSGTTVTGWSNFSIVINRQIGQDFPNAEIIGVNAFYNKGYTFNMANLTFPNTLTTIKSDAYHNATGITGTVDFLSLTQLITVETEAFRNCRFTGTITFPSSLTTLGSGSFSGLSNLTNLDLSNLTVTSLTNNVFSDNNCSTLILPNSLQTIGQQTFRGCNKLLLLNLKNVQTLSNQSFENCSSLTNIYFNLPITLTSNSFTRSTTAIVYAYQGNRFTIGSASGSFSTTSNPLTSYFSRWRLYDQPYPTSDSFFSSSINTFYKEFTPKTDFTFYTYNVNIVTYTVVVKDANGDVVIIDQPTITRTGYLYTFSYELPNGLPSGSKIITLNNSLVLNLIELECSSFGRLNDSYNAGEIIFITWSGTYPPYNLTFNGPGIVPRPIVTNYIGNNYPYPIPVSSIAGKYNIAITNSNSCTTFSKSFFVVPCITINPMDAYYHDFITVSWVSFRASYNVTLIGENGSETPMGTTNLKTLTWAIPPDTIPGLYQVQVSSADGYCIALSNRFLIVTLQDICFVKDTLVETDQGNIPIQLIIPGKHTVFNQKIIDLTTTIHPDSHLVHIKAFAFGPYPTKDTTVSQEHKINGVGSFREAKDYVNGSTVTLVPYDYQPLYNVLLIRPGFMRVHGMMVETLDPYVTKHEPKRKMLKK